MKAISSMATRNVLADLAAAATATGLPELHIESVGGVDAAARVASGEAFDLVFLADYALHQLADDGYIDAVSITPLVLSQVAVAVPSGDDHPGSKPRETAFADAASVREALRSASRIGYSTGPSGTALVEMIDRWQLTDDLRGRLIRARPGVPVARLLASGEVDLGIQQLSELVGEPGIRILGAMPPDCAIDTVFSGAVAATSSDAAAARDILGFFAADAAAPIKGAHNFSTL